MRVLSWETGGGNSILSGLQNDDSPSFYLKFWLLLDISDHLPSLILLSSFPYLTFYCKSYNQTQFCIFKMSLLSLFFFLHHQHEKL